MDSKELEAKLLQELEKAKKEVIEDINKKTEMEHKFLGEISLSVKDELTAEIQSKIYEDLDKIIKDKTNGQFGIVDIVANNNSKSAELDIDIETKLKEKLGPYKYALLVQAREKHIHDVDKLKAINDELDRQANIKAKIRGVDWQTEASSDIFATIKTALDHRAIGDMGESELRGKLFILQIGDDFNFNLVEIKPKPKLSFVQKIKAFLKREKSDSQLLIEKFKELETPRKIDG